MDNINPLSHLFNRLTMDSWHALQNAQQNHPFIILKPDKANKTLSIIHNGTGMSKKELDAIVRDGAKEFTQVFQAAGANVISMIGEFSCGFYTANLVVEKVTVTTKRNHDDDQYKMESHAGGSFTITRDDNGEPLARGTMVTLFLKGDQLEYLEERKIRDLVKELPEFINCPIYLLGAADETEIEEVEVPNGCQIIRGKIHSHSSGSGGQQHVKHKTSDRVLCNMIKGILGNKVADVNIASESFCQDSSSLSCCRFTSKRILEISPNSDILELLRKMGGTDQQNNELDSVKAIVKLLFESARSTPRPNKVKNWRKLAKVLSVCCSIINLTAAVLSCVASGCGGGGA